MMMEKKLLSIGIMMLLITTLVPTVRPLINYVQHGAEKSVHITEQSSILSSVSNFGLSFPFYQYPTMNTYEIQIHPDSVSEKPQPLPTPDSFSWLDVDGQDWTTPAKKQLRGDCWDFAALGIIESIIKIREECSGFNPDLSEQYVLSCLPEAGSCHGGSSSEALELIMATTPEGNYYNGIIPETCFPYQADDTIPCEEKCPNWLDLLIPLLDCGSFRPDGSSTDRESIKTQIMTMGPVVAGIRTTDLFSLWGTRQHSPTKYFPFLKQVFGVNHVVMIVGWHDSPLIRKGGYWICKNSWGTDWGYNGFFNIEYNALNIDSSIIAWADYDPATVDFPPLPNAGGLYFGDIGEEIVFDATDSFDPENNIVSYLWDFGDGTNDTGVSVPHAYTQQGIYLVTLVVTDSSGNTASDSTWAGIEESIDPPTAPAIDGPHRIAPETVYEFTFSTIDPNGDDVYYFIEWGDYHSVGEWIGPYQSGEEVTFSYSWAGKNTYSIKAKAKDVYDQESDWTYFEVAVPQNTLLFHNHPILQWLFASFPNLFQFIHVLLK